MQKNGRNRCFCGEMILFFRKRHNRVHPGNFATQQGTPFYLAGMSAADWSTLIFTLPRRKIAWVHPTKATFFQNCTLILDKYPVVSENETLPPAISPAKFLSAPTKGHQNTDLPALNIQPRRTCPQLLQPFIHIDSSRSNHSRTSKWRHQVRHFREKRLLTRAYRTNVQGTHAKNIRGKSMDGT